jgi:hypothetical protein
LALRRRVSAWIRWAISTVPIVGAIVGSWFEVVHAIDSTTHAINVEDGNTQLNVWNQQAHSAYTCSGGQPQTRGPPRPVAGRGGGATTTSVLGS